MGPPLCVCLCAAGCMLPELDLHNDCGLDAGVSAPHEHMRSAQLSPESGWLPRPRMHALAPTHESADRAN
jgi:hypothetical protein